MARQVYSQNFFAAHAFTGLSGPYTVPLDQVWVVRDVDVYINTVNPLTAFLYVRDHITTGTFVVFGVDSAHLGVPYSQQWRGRQVFGPGTSFDVSAADTWDCRISGYALSYP